MSTASVAVEQGRRFSFDLGRAICFDLEVYPGRWAVGFYGPCQPGSDDLVATIVDGDRKRLFAILKKLAASDRILVGYNSQRFDVPLVRVILAGLDPYAPAQT